MLGPQWSFHVLFSFLPYVLLACITLALPYLYQLWRRRQHWNVIMSRVPHDPDYSVILGHTSKFRTPQLGVKYFTDLCVKYFDHGLYAVSLGPFKCVVNCTNPESVRTLLKQSTPKGPLYDELSMWLGHGLVTAQGSAWRRSRKLISPSFHFETLHSYIPIMFDHVHQLTSHWASRIEEHPDTPIDLCLDISLSTLDVIGECAFSTQFGALHGNNSDYVAAVMRSAHNYWQRNVVFPDVLIPGSVYYWLTKRGRAMIRDYKTMHDFTSRVIAQRLSELQGRGELETVTRGKQDFLATLLCATDDQGCYLTDKEITEEVDTFLFAGHDTTSSGIMWILYDIITAAPEILQRIRAEIEQVYSGKDGPLTYHELGQLRYLTQVIKESHRLHSPVPLIARRLISPTQVCETTLPKGTEFIISPRGLHTNPRLYPNPSIFDPSRFTPEECSARDPFAYIPFSAGPRNCIGQHFALAEEKIYVSHLLRHFDLQLAPPRKVVHGVSELTLRPARHRLYIIARVRNKN